MSKIFDYLGYRLLIPVPMQKRIETELHRTDQSIRKLAEELKFIDGEHGLYELLESFVGALVANRGEDRAAWSEEGQELGEMLDRIKADMEWWNDGVEE